jgi:transcription initiation factor TFIIIB Brf1 subunit/transcription initiation factor TFIIB
MSDELNSIIADCFPAANDGRRKRLGQHRNGPLVKVCKTCEKEFRVFRCVYERSNYCCRKCAVVGLKNLVGERSATKTFERRCPPPDSTGWTPVPGYTRYNVTPDGAIRVSTTGRVLAPFPGAAGYMRVSVVSDIGENRTVYLHSLILAAFSGPRPSNAHECAHLDGNRSNNCISNLVWATPLENSSHKFAHGTVLEGDKATCRVLSSDDVREIRKSVVYKQRGGKAVIQNRGLLAKRYGVYGSTIANAIKGITWKSVPREDY